MKTTRTLTLAARAARDEALYRQSCLYEYGGSAAEWSEATERLRKAERVMARAKAREMRMAQKNATEVADWLRLEA